jgi:1,2-dihydroxy-3-keto-5-methylthiopentene dioxygenase
MAVVEIPDEGRAIHDAGQIRSYLTNIGVDYERWESAKPLPTDASADEILDAYSDQIAQLKSKGGYTTADVIDIRPDLPGLDAMLARFNTEHWHDEDEVRYIIAGRGLFHLHPATGPVVAVEVEAGDLIRVPRGTLHWFNLCGDRRIRAIRLFQNQSGWSPNYTKSDVDRKYEPVCLGPAFILPRGEAQ